MSEVQEARVSLQKVLYSGDATGDFDPDLVPPEAVSTGSKVLELARRHANSTAPIDAKKELDLLRLIEEEADGVGLDNLIYDTVIDRLRCLLLASRDRDSRKRD